MNRLTRLQAAEYLGCSPASFALLLKSKQLEGTYYSVLGRRFFITSKLDEWMNKGGSEQFKAGCDSNGTIYKERS